MAGLDLTGRTIVIRLDEVHDDLGAMRDEHEALELRPGGSSRRAHSDADGTPVGIVRAGVWRQVVADRLVLVDVDDPEYDDRWSLALAFDDDASGRVAGSNGAAWLAGAFRLL
jgi:hypothetical protein